MSETPFRRETSADEVISPFPTLMESRRSLSPVTEAEEPPAAPPQAEPEPAVASAPPAAPKRSLMRRLLKPRGRDTPPEPQQPQPLVPVRRRIVQQPDEETPEPTETDADPVAAVEAAPNPEPADAESAATTVRLDADGDEPDAEAETVRLGPDGEPVAPDDTAPAATTAEPTARSDVDQIDAADTELDGADDCVAASDPTPDTPRPAPSADAEPRRFSAVIESAPDPARDPQPVLRFAPPVKPQAIMPPPADATTDSPESTTDETATPSRAKAIFRSRPRFRFMGASRRTSKKSETGTTDTPLLAITGPDRETETVTEESPDAAADDTGDVDATAEPSASVHTEAAHDDSPVTVASTPDDSPTTDDEPDDTSEPTSADTEPAASAVTVELTPDGSPSEGHEPSEPGSGPSGSVAGEPMPSGDTQRADGEADASEPARPGDEPSPALRVRGPGLPNGRSQTAGATADRAPALRFRGPQLPPD